MYFANFFLGLSLITSPFAFNYTYEISGYNSIVCGILVCVFSLFSINPMNLWAPWGMALIGLWLNVAPLLFWSKLAVIYNTDTLTGILIIVFSFVAPGMPGKKLVENEGPEHPAGWNVNPSSWAQRIPIITIGWIGFFASRYLASYQLGYLPVIDDWFFGKGTENVLNSDISKAWPVSDAGLGAFSYMLDAIMGYIGGVNRWRTMPWVVILFGILIIPLGAVSIGLIISQPVVVGAWCSVCLFTAAAMLIMIPCTFDEVFASLWYLRASKIIGRPYWKTFFLGGGALNNEKFENLKPVEVSVGGMMREIFSGFTVPWNLLLSCAIGIWLMFAPSLLKYDGTRMADSDHVVGALIVTFSVIAMGEIVRVVRFINILFGLWIVLVPFIFGYTDKFALINAIAVGLLIIVLSFRKGKTENSYGTFNKYIF